MYVTSDDGVSRLEYVTLLGGLEAGGSKLANKSNLI